MNPSQAFENLGKVLNVDLAFDAEGTCTVAFAEVEIHFKGTEQDLYMLSSIGSLEAKEYLYKDILELNYLGVQTQYATLSIDANTLMLHIILHAPFDETTLEEALTLFVNNVRYWREWLESAEEKEGENTTESQNHINLLETSQMLKI